MDSMSSVDPDDIPALDAGNLKGGLVVTGGYAIELILSL